MMVPLPGEPPAAAPAAAADGEARLRRHRAARDRARSQGHESGGAGAGGGRRREHLQGATSGGSKGSRAPARRLQRGSGAKSVGPGLPASPANAAPHSLNHDEVEARWQEYLLGEEFVTFSTLASTLQSLPSASQVADHRWDFELVIHLLHRLGVALGVEHASKSYRAHYSPDVQLSGYLYSTLLTAFTLLPSYVLNGQEFYVSDTVLDQCQSLQYVFLETCKELRRQFEGLQPYSLEQIRSDVKRSLVYFDRSWCRFEMPALEEIEAIHKQACRPLIEAIDVERGLGECESGGSAAAAARSCHAVPAPSSLRVRLDVQRTRLMEKICELNRLANLEGRARGDMDLTPIIEAERIAARPLCTCCAPGGSGVADAATTAPPKAAEVSERRGRSHVGGSPAPSAQPAPRRCGCGGTSPVLLKIARSLLRSLSRLRRVLQKYSRCLYQLNSHLANNPDLVRSLELFEAAWETACRYLVQSAPRRLALLAYDVVQGVKEPGFQASLASLDPGFLVASLPRALLLFEMRRVAAGGSASGGARSSPAPVAKPHKAGAPGATELPRPGLDKGPRRGGAAQTTALQRSPLARTFLPPDVAASYNETVDILSRMSEARLDRLQAQLLAPAVGCGSVPSTARAATSGSKTPLARPPPSATPSLAPPPTGGGGRGVSSCGRGVERPPQTPCPPRMAVPNSERPETSKRLNTGSAATNTLVVQRAVMSPSGTTYQSAAVSTLPEESDDDEDEESLAIDFSVLRDGAEKAAMATLVEGSAAREAFAAASGGGDGSPLRTQASCNSLPPLQAACEARPNPSAHASPVPSRAAAASLAGGPAREERDAKQVVAMVSTLALQLQRARAHEWNELIQVVLQGLMLAESAAGDAAPAPAPVGPARPRCPPGAPAEVW